MTAARKTATGAGRTARSTAKRAVTSAVRSSKKKPTADAAVPAGTAPAFQQLVDSFAGRPQVELGRMFGAPGLKTEGKVFAMLVKGRLVVKLPKARVDELVAKGRGEYFDPGHGRLMKEWLSAPEGTAAAWAALAQAAFDYVGGH